MDEYISRSAALKAVGESSWAGFRLNEIPAADVIECPRWIPVKERLPDVGSSCLISPVSGCVAEGQYDGDGWTQYRWSAKLDKDAVTHWMPLPALAIITEG